jgi:hypothetical protein
MAFTLKTMLTARTPRYQPMAGAPAFLTGGLPKVGSVLTANTGQWVGQGSQNPRFQWYSGGSSILNATNASFSVQSAGGYLTCRMSMGNATWGTTFKDVATGTVIA